MPGGLNSPHIVRRDTCTATHPTLLRPRYSTLSRRRNLELEGFTTDVSLLRRTIGQLEGQWAVLGESMALSSTLASTTIGSASGSGSRSRSKLDSTTVEGASPPSRRPSSAKGAGVAGTVNMSRVKSSGYGAPAGASPSTAGAKTRRQRSSGGVPAHGGGGVKEAYGAKEGKGVSSWPPAHNTIRGGAPPGMERGNDKRDRSHSHSRGHSRSHNHSHRVYEHSSKESR